MNNKNIVANENERKISDSFEKSFLSRTINDQAKLCETNEISAIFRKYLANHQPILEAGSGSGRWVAWFAQNNWDAVGLDWSEALTERARQEIPNARFECGDMRNMPFKDKEFGSIVSLGAIEHSINGPNDSLIEYYRVLNDTGIAIITVPYGSKIRKNMYPFTYFKIRIKSLNIVRKLFKKKTINNSNIKLLKKSLNNKWHPIIVPSENGWQFYEYRFNDKQMRYFLSKSEFTVIENFYMFKDQGLLHTFGSLVGNFNYNNGKVNLTIIGKILYKLIPTSAISHMLCYVVKKK